MVLAGLTMAPLAGAWITIDCAMTAAIFMRMKIGKAKNAFMANS